MIRIDNDWAALFDAEQAKPYYLDLRRFLVSEYGSRTIYPPMNDIFNAFRFTSFSQAKVIIVGQDPYHEQGQAMGLSFSVRESVEEPPSLVNIHKEIEDEDVEKGPWSRDLTRWARQGVLLLNSTLTVQAHNAASHAGRGWEIFTDNAIKALGADSRPKVFMLWGSYARSKKALISSPSHLILESAHPSPLSAYRGFFGNGHFRKCNEFLKSKGADPIIW
ncbi:MAG: uracil-DNA glycosylase [Sphaerochaetaceae bacterium]|jgi:uracil-DNA glycosylase|nr:uracil-DNA glycosylase [Sphaerochaetaceae bacterium]